MRRGPLTPPDLNPSRKQQRKIADPSTAALRCAGCARPQNRDEQRRPAPVKMRLEPGRGERSGLGIGLFLVQYKEIQRLAGIPSSIVRVELSGSLIKQLTLAYCSCNLKVPEKASGRIITAGRRALTSLG